MQEKLEQSKQTDGEKSLRLPPILALAILLAFTHSQFYPLDDGQTRTNCFLHFAFSTFGVVSAMVGLGFNMLSLQLINQNLVLLQNQNGLLLYLITGETEIDREKRDRE